MPRPPRFPFPEFPRGWFAAGFSAELRPGRLLRQRWMGEDVVLFRDSAGRPVVMDAHCPHMGAHLGEGGMVSGGCVRCPFHNFVFDGEGRCVSTPYGGKPPSARARTWPVVERDGLVLAYFDPGGSPPAWEIPAVEREGWGALHVRRYMVRTHPQETTENSVDFGHLSELHGYRDVRQVEDLRLDGPALSVSFTFRRRAGVLGRRDRWIEVRSDVTVLGLGFSVVEVAVAELGLRTRHYVLPTPARNGRMTMRAGMRLGGLDEPGRLSAALAVLPPGLASRFVGRLVFEGFTRDLRQDFRIWENKRYIDPPALAAGDGPIGRYRRWCRQFYESAPGK